MSDYDFKVKFYGVRGSLPVPGKNSLKFGGNTSCVVVSDDDYTIVFDAGTGIREFGKEVLDSDLSHMALFFSHYHWDHLQGFSFFTPLQRKKDFTIDAYGETKIYGTPETIISGQMTHPYFPVTISDLSGKVNFQSIKKGDVIDIGPFSVKAVRLRHPDGVLGYKITKNGKSVMYGTDYEHIEGQDDQYYLDELKGIDCLLHDAAYTSDEYAGKDGPPRKGWGHSTWEVGCEIAKKAGIKQLVLTHHEIERTDDKVLAIEKEAKKVFSNTIAAYEGLELTF
jgi:phosphoribosyl 1,2-cyclic phosphodiesterase